MTILIQDVNNTMAGYSNLGKVYPSQSPIGTYGATILVPSALDPGWTHFANRTLSGS